MLQSSAVQQQLLKLGVLDWVLSEITTEPAQQVQLILPDINDPKQPNALDQQPASFSAPDAGPLLGRSAQNGGTPSASSAEHSFDAVAAANREGAVYNPPGPASPSAAAPASVIAQQMPAREPLQPTHLQSQGAVQSPVQANKSPIKKDDDMSSLADSFRDENRPLSSNGASLHADKQTAETAASPFPPGFISSGDAEDDMDRIEAWEASERAKVR